MRQIFLFATVLILAVLSSAQSWSREPSPPDYNRFDARYSMQDTQDTRVDALRELPEKLRKQYVEALIEYNKKAMQHRLTTLWTQYVSSIIIFVIVVGIVLFGAIMSYKQFKSGFDVSARTTTIRFGQYGVEVSTSVTGIVILVISLAFFYLYIAAVFPITEIGAR